MNRRKLKAKTVGVRVKPSDLKYWKLAAGREGTTLSEWIRRVCMVHA